MNCRYTAYYCSALPISRLAIVDKPFLYHEGIKTGGMSKDKFLSLKENIKERGLINPIIVEVDSGGPPRYRIAMGNNRVEVYRALGKDTIKAVVIHRANSPKQEDGPYEIIKDVDFISCMGKIHPGDDLWKKSPWAQKILKFVNEKTF